MSTQPFNPVTAQATKAGYLTTEFWVTIVAQGLALLVITGVVRTEDRGTLETSITRGIEAAFAFIASATTIWKYIQSRGETKRKAIEAETAQTVSADARQTAANAFRPQP